MSVTVAHTGLVTNDVVAVVISWTRLDPSHQKHNDSLRPQPPHFPSANHVQGSRQRLESSHFQWIFKPSSFPPFLPLFFLLPTSNLPTITHLPSLHLLTFHQLLYLSNISLLNSSHAYHLDCRETEWGTPPPPPLPSSPTISFHFPFPPTKIIKNHHQE